MENRNGIGLVPAGANSQKQNPRKGVLTNAGFNPHEQNLCHNASFGVGLLSRENDSKEGI